MLNNENLVSIKRSLEQILKYCPHEAIVLKLDNEMVRDLLDFLSNADEYVVDKLIDERDLRILSYSGFEEYIKKDMAISIAKKLYEDGFIKYLCSDGDPETEYMCKKIHASLIAVKPKENQNGNQY